jgi:hypothetical protein
MIYCARSLAIVQSRFVQPVISDSAAHIGCIECSGSEYYTATGANRLKYHFNLCSSLHRTYYRLPATRTCCRKFISILNRLKLRIWRVEHVGRMHGIGTQVPTERRSAFLEAYLVGAIIFKVRSCTIETVGELLPYHLPLSKLLGTNTGHYPKAVCR